MRKQYIAMLKKNSEGIRNKICGACEQELSRFEHGLFCNNLRCRRYNIDSLAYKNEGELCAS